MSKTNQSATVNQVSTARNIQPPAATTHAPQGPAGRGETAPHLPDLEELTAAALMAAGKIADKESARDGLTDGHDYVFDLRVSGSIDSLPVDQTYCGILSVGSPTTRASSSTPYKELLSYVLGKLNAATRESILRDLPEDYAAGPLPCDPETEAAVETTLKRLRATTQTTVKGSVSCRYVAAPGR